MALGVALFSQPDCDSLGHSVWLVPGQGQMGCVGPCSQPWYGGAGTLSCASPIEALGHWGRKVASLCLGVVWSLQTSFQELPRRTNKRLTGLKVMALVSLLSPCMPFFPFLKVRLQ